eukprot:SAG11_NODE_4668_length_1813_cov_1.866978_2_plen_157_part_00
MCGVVVAAHPHVASYCCGRQLDKREQVSTWGARPLTPSQLEYAALDATTLVLAASTLAELLAFTDITNSGASPDVALERALKGVAALGMLQSFTRSNCVKSCAKQASAQRAPHDARRVQKAEAPKAEAQEAKNVDRTADLEELEYASDGTDGTDTT